MPDQRELELLLNTEFPIISIETHEEIRALQLFKKMKTTRFSIFTWTTTEGLNPYAIPNISHLTIEDYTPKQNNQHSNPSNITIEPEVMLNQVKNDKKNIILLLLDFHPYIDDPKIIRLIKEIAQQYTHKKVKLIFVSHELSIPEEIKKFIIKFELSLPGEEQIRKLILDEAKQWYSMNAKKKIQIDKNAIELLVKNLQGLTFTDARRLIKNAIYNDGAITHSDIKEVMNAKYQLVGQQGVLSFEYETSHFSEVGGFDNLKQWLSLRKNFFANTSSDDIDIPKGLLLLGVQGCGKSLAARAIAGSWEVPLLRFDFSTLYNKYIGETEKNIRDTLKSAELLAPCILWIDEIEKAIQTGNDDSGTSQRILGTLLTWMAEKKHRVFIVATANDIHSLPPELIRKGRLDEIFFVDLPKVTTRVAILEIHLKKRRLSLTTDELMTIALETEGFSGAELEQLVVSARFAAKAHQKPFQIQDLKNAIKNTQPLSITLKEKLNALRKWGKTRAVNVE